MKIASTKILASIALLLSMAVSFYRESGQAQMAPAKTAPAQAPAQAALGMHGSTHREIDLPASKQ